MAKNIKSYPINAVWAENSTNKIAFTDAEFSNGIEYKGAIVSNQLNGVSNALSQALQFQQVTGGYYQQGMVYHVGNIVKYLQNGNLLTFRCINDNEGKGITHPPIIDNLMDDNTGDMVGSYGGRVNVDYWSIVNTGGDVAFQPQSVVCDSTNKDSTFQYACEFFNVKSVLDTLNSFHVEDVFSLRATVKIATYFKNKIALVTLSLKGEYLKQEDGKYLVCKDYFGMPFPDVYIDDVTVYSTSDVSGGLMSSVNTSVENSANLILQDKLSQELFFKGRQTPYGFNVAAGYYNNSDGSKDYKLMLVFSDAEKITCNGVSNVNVGITKSQNTDAFIVSNVIPVRSNGGAHSYDCLGQLNEYDNDIFNSNVTGLLLRGEVLLDKINTDFYNTNAKTTYPYMAFNISHLLSFITHKSEYRLNNHEGQHTRFKWGRTFDPNDSLRSATNHYAGEKAGEYIKPGIPNVYGIFNNINLNTDYNNWNQGQFPWEPASGDIRNGTLFYDLETWHRGYVTGKGTVNLNGSPSYQYQYQEDSHVTSFIAKPNVNQFTEPYNNNLDYTPFNPNYTGCFTQSNTLFSAPFYYYWRNNTMSATARALVINASRSNDIFKESYKTFENSVDAGRGNFKIKQRNSLNYYKDVTTEAISVIRTIKAF